MIAENIIEEVKERLVKTYHPIEIYLFGSYAWGSPDEESDLDILVIVEGSDEKRFKRSLPASLVLRDLMVPKDILVVTKSEFEKSSNDVATLFYKIKHKGKKIYASA